MNGPTREQVRDALIAAYDAGWGNRHLHPELDLGQQTVRLILEQLYPGDTAPT